MAGDYALMRAKVERAGVIFAETLEELGDISEILLRSPALTAREVAVLGEKRRLQGADPRSGRGTRPAACPAA
jgi:hypothetical protein